MSNFSRRIFLILLGGLATSGITQSSDAASTKKPTPTPTPRKTTPAPKKPKPKKPTPTPVRKTPVPSQTPKATPTPAQSKVVEGVFIARSVDLAMGQTKVFFIKDSFGIPTNYSLFRTSKGVFAFDTRCTHAGVPTFLRDSQLQCPAHGSIFSPETGQVIRGPAVEQLRSYRIIEANGEIRIIIS